MGIENDNLVINDTTVVSNNCGNGKQVEVVIPANTLYVPRFKYCDSLKWIDVEKGNPTYNSIEGILYKDHGNMLVQCPQAYESHVVYIPEGVQQIGKHAFHGCRYIEEIILPSSLKCICGNAFNGCSSLKRIIIPDQVSVIAFRAFNGCSSLREIRLPSKISCIGGALFDGCESLDRILIPEGALGMDNSTFYKHYNLPPIQVQTYANEDSLTCNGCDFEPAEDIDISFVVRSETIRSQALINVGHKLKHLIVPEFVKKIKGYAFEGCSLLTDIQIPAEVAFISSKAFQGCNALQRIEVEPDNMFYCSVDGILYDKKCQTLVRAPQTLKKKRLSLPSSLKRIDKFAFEGCTCIEEVIIPDSVRYIGDNAFEGCSSLVSVKIGRNVTVIKEKTFKNCSSLKKIIVPSNVACIESYAFMNCVSLREIFVPKSVTRIGRYPFLGCRSIKRITVDPNNEYYFSIEGALLFCGFYVNDEHGHQWFYQYSREHARLMVVPKKLVSYNLPPCTSGIHARAFDHSESLCEVVVPKGSLEKYQKYPELKSFKLVEETTLKFKERFRLFFHR